jgi:2-polyprenyl-6-methoxyphenol hydroxylase-like FAD-dependent oxidoreductase
MHARTLEVLDQRGVAERFLAEGKPTQALGFAGNRLDMSYFPTRFNHSLALWQRDIERILAGWVLDDLAVPIRHDRSVVGFAQDSGGVDVEVSDGTTLRAQYLVGCDGGRSIVRKAVGIEFAGWDPTGSFLVAEADMIEEPPVGLRPQGGGIGPVNRQEDGSGGAGAGPYRIVLREAEVAHAGEPTLDDLRHELVERFGSDFGVHDPSDISRFGDTSRQALDVLYDLGEVPAPPAVLIRPDGHVAWTGSLTDPSLPDALTRWFGAPAG